MFLRKQIVMIAEKPRLKENRLSNLAQNSIETGMAYVKTKTSIAFV